MSFTNKVVIVTGASAGIGADAVVQFARERAKVVIVGRNEENLQKVAEKCQLISAVYLIVKADVTKENEVNSIVEETIKKFGQLDILINNAGIIKASTLLSGKMTKIYDELMNINLKSIVVLTSLAAPYLIKTKGNIVNISSAAGSVVWSPEFTAYSMSKACLNMFTIGSSLEMASHGVRVNTISPGPVRTSIFKTGGVNVDAVDFESHSALGRISDPEEITNLILFLASDKAKGITGSNYVCDNGIIFLT